jgi:DNA-nicking Smr family endonuclease
MSVAAKKKKVAGPFDALRELKDKLSAEQNDHPPKRPPQIPPKPAAPEQPEDAALLLHRLFAGVTPLDRSRGRVPRDRGERSDGSAHPAKRDSRAEGREVDAVHERLRELVDGATRFEVADDGQRVEGRRVDVPLDAVRRLRRGLWPVDARVDLHGMGVKEARGQLEAFLRMMRARGERCVLVVHGKGEHSPQGIGVLRGEIAAWLSQGASSRDVAAFVTARTSDGGEGAVYVLLRK